MTDDLKTFIITVISLSIGWILSEFSSYLKTRRDEKTSLKEVLHTQLNIWFLIKRTNIDFIAKGIEEALNQATKSIPEKGDVDKINKIFKSFIESIVHENFSDSIKEIGPKYKSDIEALARHFPILAYRIGGKQIIYDYLNTIDKYLKKVNEKLTGLSTIETNAEETFGIIREKIKPFLYNETLETIETDIKLVARRLGLLDWFRVWRLMRSKPEEKILDEYTKKLLSFFKAVELG